MTARIGRRVDRNVYWNDQPLFVAATPELAAEIVSVLNRGSEATPTAAPGSDGGFPPMPEWHPTSDTPESGCRIVGLYDDGSGAVPLFIYDGGSLDADGGECGPWPIKHLGRWAYLPHDWEFHCEGHPTEPVTISARSPAALARRSTPTTGGAAQLDREAVGETDSLRNTLIKARNALAILGGDVDACRKTICEIDAILTLDLDPQPQEASEEVREALSSVLASLVAAIYLLERGGKEAAASDKMFATMLEDYRKAVEQGRKALAAITPAGRGADAGDVSKEK